MKFASGFGEILVWTANVLRNIYPDTAAPSNTTTPFQIQLSSETPTPQIQHNQHNTNPNPSLPFNLNLEPNLNHNLDTTPTPCIFHTPLQPPSNLLALPDQTWAFLSALLSHRIQGLHHYGESVTDTISVRDELFSFDDFEGQNEEGKEMRIKEGFEMVDGLFIGLVYGGREDGGKGDDGGDVQGCVENAIRGVYQTRQLSGWMNLGSGEGAGNEDGEWVSYLIYQDE